VIDFFENPTVNSALYNKSVAVFEENINARLDELINMTGGAIDIGVRTAVVINAHRALLLKYNEIVRATALRRNLTIFDFNDDIWSIIGFDATYESFLLRDWMHPKDVFTSIAGEKMLGNQYSRYMTIKRNSSYFENRFLSFYNDSTITVKLIRESRENESFSFNITQHHHAGVYFYMNGLRWSKPHHEFLKIARLGPGDVFLVSNETLQKIPEGPQVPNHIFLENTVLNWTTKGETYLIADGCRRKFTNVKSVEGGYKDYFVIERADDPWIQMIPFGNDLPDVFRDDTLVRLSGARECFIVRNGSRHSITNLAVFLTLGRDFSEVKNLDWNDLNMIPLGLPLPG
jgi:hypothetical protein